eukprot:TRINITY_DN22837_c0_g1_i1.p1 TRINITY_DN22837_c0_g1~~TRINITY_DN22837_c0_g1_i1.p1  ORF type:complete len:591 (-),score=93.47 TRINITY_DN22837_c0_g1_i1:29-1801(-)
MLRRLAQCKPWLETISPVPICRRLFPLQYSANVRSSFVGVRSFSHEATRCNGVAAVSARPSTLPCAYSRNVFSRGPFEFRHYSCMFGSRRADVVFGPCSSRIRGNTFVSREAKLRRSYAASATPPAKPEGAPSSAPSVSPILGGLPYIVGGVASFLAFDACMKSLMAVTGASAYLPPQIAGMLAAFSSLCLSGVAAPAATASFHAMLMPGVNFVNRWMPVFLVPVQVMLPTIVFPGGSVEAVTLLAFLSGSWLVSTALTARLVAAAQSLAAPAAATAGAAAAGAPPKTPAWLPALWLCLAALCFTQGCGVPALDIGLPASAQDAARGANLAAVGAGSFALGLCCGIPGHLSFLLCGAATIADAALLGLVRGEGFETVVRRDYIAPDARGAGDYLLWFLSPALVATGVQMFQYRSRIRAYGLILFACCSLTSLANILGTAALAPTLGISPSTTLAATVRCVTVPMGLPCYSRLSETAGTDFNVGLMALCAGLSGFLGFGASGAVLARLGYQASAQPVVRGVAVGSSAHVLGSAAFAAREPEALAWGMLAMAFSGVLSAFWLCGCPPVTNLVVSLATRGDPAAKTASDGCST